VPTLFNIEQPHLEFWKDNMWGGRVSLG